MTTASSVNGADTMLWDAWLSTYTLPALTVADELGIFDKLDRPMSAADLARSMRISARGVVPLLQLLHALGYLLRSGSTYTTAPAVAPHLRRDGELYWGYALAVLRADSRLHDQLLSALQGTHQAITAPGSPAAFWGRGSVDADAAVRIGQFLDAHSRTAARELARLACFKRVSNVLDLGGGTGRICLELAASHAHLTCQILELPGMATYTRHTVRASIYNPRVRVLEGNMFLDDLPTSAECIVLSNILHDWPEDVCRQLIAKAFNVLPVNGHILLHEMLLDDAAPSPTTAAMSLMLFLGTPGRQYSVAEFTGMLRNGGFIEIEHILTSGYFGVIHGVKGGLERPQ